MIEVAIIPIGQKQPNTFKEIGAVKICAEVDDERDIVKYAGKNRTYKLVKSLLKIRIPASAAYERIKPILFKLWGVSTVCNKKLKHSITSISGFSLSTSEERIKRQLHMNALKSDGEKPANQTNKITATVLIINDNFFLLIFLPINIAIPENIERCIPERARICDNPDFLKASVTVGSVYSFDPESNASKSPPPFPQEYISLLN